MKLATLCDVKAGHIVSRLKSKNDEDNKIEYEVLLPKAIQNGMIIPEDLAVELLSKNPPEDCITKEGDIVMKLSSPYGAAYVTKENAGLLVPSFCCRLSGFKNIDPFFLITYLNSNKARFQYEALCGGAVIAILRIGSIRDLVIPDCSLGIQKEIGERYKRIQKMMRLVEEAAALEMQRAEIYF